jgi:hypothetical protein
MDFITEGLSPKAYSPRKLMKNLLSVRFPALCYKSFVFSEHCLPSPGFSTLRHPAD